MFERYGALSGAAGNAQCRQQPAEVAKVTSPQAYAQYCDGQDNQVPREAGLASAIKELVEAAGATRQVAVALRQSLGIGAPNSPSKEPSSSPSLRDIVTLVTRSLRASNDDLSVVLGHLNS